MKDVLLEAWQANAEGIHAHPEDPRHTLVEEGFRGWGRVITDFDTGLWGFDTVKPGPTPGRMGKVQAPHISLWIVARGINIGLNTRLYFDDEAEANKADPVLNSVEQENRRTTSSPAGRCATEPRFYRFDIRLQGEDETVFFDI